MSNAVSMMINYFTLILSFGCVVFGALRIIFPTYDSYIVWGVGGWLGCVVFQIVFNLWYSSYISHKKS